ncbi:hypothetical protein ACFLXU_00800 [Chloroflexota bacterium]
MAVSGYIRLENEGGPKSRRNEQVARSEAECQSGNYVFDGCHSKPTINANGGEGSSPPSFLVRNKDNVNVPYSAAIGLITMWDFLLYKGRIGMTQIILNKKTDKQTMKLMPAKGRCRYFDEGRIYMSNKIKKRLGKYEKVPGLMQTLTYNPKQISKQEAWASFGKDTRRFLNAVNQYRKRRGWHRTHYLWVVEVQKGTGYPHVHIFFPNLRFLAPISILTSNWSKGRANISSPKKIKTNCAGYISKYLRKMHGWTDLHQALLWSGGCRMYSFSRGFSAKVEKKESEWTKWAVVKTDNVDELEYGLMRGGYVIEINSS